MTAPTGVPRRVTLLLLITIATLLGGLDVWAAVARPIALDPHTSTIPSEVRWTMPGHRIDLNKADTDALQLLPGIGPRTVEKLRPFVVVH